MRTPRLLPLMALLIAPAAFLPRTDCAPCAFAGSAYGPVLTVNNGPYPAYVEFSRTGYDAKVAMGALGGVEANVSYNMNYADNTHKLYDPSKDAYWSAWNPFGYTLQMCTAGTNAEDCWTNRGMAVIHYAATEYVSNSAKMTVPYQSWIYNSTNSAGGASAWQRSGDDVGYVGDAKSLSSGNSAGDFSIWAVNNLIVHGAQVSLEGDVTMNGAHLQQLLDRLDARIRSLEAQVKR